MECEEFFSSLRTGHPPTIQPRPCRPKAGIGIVMMMVIMMVTMMVMMTMIHLVHGDNSKRLFLPGPKENPDDYACHQSDCLMIMIIMIINDDNQDHPRKMMKIIFQSHCHWLYEGY